MRSRRVAVSGQIIGDVLVREVPSPNRVFVLLHGFAQNGEKIFSKLNGVVPKDAFVLAPNGPYPLPERTRDGWKMGFSWYFYNFETDEYYIDMENAFAYLAGLLKEAGLQNVPATVIGFSQGGYLAPLFAKKRAQIDHVIGVGCEFLKDEIEDPVTFRIDQVHGAEDAVVDLENSKNSHAVLLSRGAKGRFIEVPAEGHRLSQGIVQAISGLLLA